MAEFKKFRLYRVSGRKISHPLAKEVPKASYSPYYCNIDDAHLYECECETLADLLSFATFGDFVISKVGSEYEVVLYDDYIE